MADPTKSPRAQRAHLEILDDSDAARERRELLKSRHSHALTRLLEERDDLRGVHPLADLVADSLRWSA